MPTTPSLKPKPRSEKISSEITRMPGRNLSRRAFRWVFKMILRLLVWAFIRIDTQGLEHIPDRGPMLVVGNHLGDADWLLGLLFAPDVTETLMKAELHEYPVIGKLIDAYGVIWIHRGQPDRRALRTALRGLKDGHLIAIAPEGRESLTGSLEEGIGGAAYLAWKSGAPILPITFTGTENARIYANMKRLRRSHVTLTVGEPFHLNGYSRLHAAVEAGTQIIMETLASQLPPEYRGVYDSASRERRGPEEDSAT
jgi:1-acyl-sn-glycerol-3-phosphate acyltransferase